MADGSRIPRQIVAFHIYFNNGYTYLTTGSPTNATRLQLPAADIALMLSILTSWTPLITKYLDKSNGRTLAVIKQLKLLIEKFVNYDRTTAFLARIASSPTVTIADLEVFAIKQSYLKPRTRTVAQTNITETIVASISPIGGAQLAIKCRLLSNGRATICSGADSVQFCYAIGTAPESPGVIGQTKEISTKASFTLVLDTTYSGSIIYIYFRCYNTKRPNLAGPWSVQYSSLIL